MPPYKTGFVKARRNGRADLSGSSVFEIEDLAIELPAPESSSTALQSNELSVISPQTPIRRVNLSILDNESTPSDDSSAMEITELPSGSSEVIFMPLTLAAALVPRFDGKSCSINKFINQCRLADSRIKPGNRINLLALIRNKIEGHADQLISNSNNPTTLDELINLLKSAFARSFDVDRVHDELRNLRQKDNESVDSYGARANEILNRGTEAANEKFDMEQSIGVKVLLKHAAITGFKRGLRSCSVRTLMIREQVDSLGIAIDVASGIEREFEYEKQTPHSKAVVSNTKVCAVNVDDRRCYSCNQPGHLRRNCPKNRNTWHNLPSRQEIRCNNCKKTGHTEDRCFRKNIPRGSNISQSSMAAASRNSQDLNLQGVPQASATRTRPLIARVETIEPSTNLTQ